MKLFVPEVIQSSAMDCGPASLKCLLDGFGVRVSYGRLREACQTDVDGTSIDTLEDVAVQLGLDAEQVMVPADHVLLPAAGTLPALAVVRLPSGLTHFVVIWRKHGGVVQVMDPGTGRRWPAARSLLEEIYVHEMPVGAADWREWAGTDEFVAPLRSRIGQLGLGAAAARRMVDAALADDGWRALATLDAATRMVAALVRSGGIRRGGDARRVLQACLEDALAAGAGAEEIIANSYWSVFPVGEQDPEEEEQVVLRGAVLVHVRGARRRQAQKAEAGAEGEQAEQLSADLVAALEEPPARPGRELLRMMRADGLLAPSMVVMALLMAAAGVVFEAVLFRGLLDMGQMLGLGEQRLGAVAALLVFMAAMLALELPIATTVLRLGRHLEARLRVAFLEKIPRLGDRYFHSRLTSDMAERSHSIQGIRGLPGLATRFLRSTFALALTTVGIAWIDPWSAPVAAVVAGVSVVLPLALQPVLAERDLRVHTHSGALSRFYLDALLGLVPIRTHGAELSVRREHESLLTEWARSSTSLLRAALAVEGVLAVTGIGLACWLLFGYMSRSGELGGVLLLVYWALNLPALGQQVAQAARQYPSLRSVTLRLMEPLGAPEEGGGEVPTGAASGRSGGASIELAGVTVMAAGHEIVKEVDLRVEPGSHLAVVGPSGAGKSSLVGILLGWHQPAAGQVLVDGVALEGAELERLRRQTAWVDPAVQLWNRPFLDNLRYGLDAGTGLPFGEVIKQANLRGVLESLPDGLQTRLGESGALISGGEGQRVRLARGMIRPDVRLVILDEPFRGVDRGARRELMKRVRAWWPEATIICITHDVGDTLEFPRVVVVEDGRVVEDGVPQELAGAETRFAALLHSEDQVRQGLWASEQWRRIRLEDGMVSERGGDP